MQSGKKVVKKAVKRRRSTHSLVPGGGGFCSAAAVLESSNNKQPKQALPQTLLSSPSATTNTLAASNLPKQQHENDRRIVVEEVLLTVVGWKYYKDDDSEPQNDTPVVLQREPTNEHDPNAIAVIASITPAKRIQIGHICAQEAQLLSPLMDSQMICVSAASIRSCFPSSFKIVAQAAAGSPEAVQVLDRFQKVAETGNYSKTIASSVIDRSHSAPYSIPTLKALDWDPLPEDGMHATDYETAASVPSWCTPYDASKWQPLTVDEILNARSASWPPSDAILLRLGLAPAGEETWYRDVAGLRSPTQWIVAGALNVLPHIQTSSHMHKTTAHAALGGAIHGVTNVWHDGTLEAMRALLHQRNFWCQRSPDALIRSFGGPYVLGQQSDKLKLVRGAPHTNLTRQMAVAHNIVYTLVHLVPPVEPGFNTLIFGCNLRGPGFHYHQDAIPGLHAKNAPLVAHQPVVTTVFYERPDVDSGKELVLWKPLLNFSPVVGGHNNQANAASGSADGSSNTEYHAARAVSTTHAMIHVQRAGLQKIAVHGIFHAPDASERQGYRVAITARITKPNNDAEASLRPFEHQYCATFGPEGDVKLPALAPPCGLSQTLGDDV